MMMEWVDKNIKIVFIYLFKDFNKNLMRREMRSINGIFREDKYMIRNENFIEWN